MDYRTKREFKDIKLSNNGGIVDAGDKDWLDNLFGKAWIPEAEQEMSGSGMHEIWERNVLYAEGEQVPVGHSNDYFKQYVRTNSGRLNLTGFKTKKDANDKIYVVDNKIPEVVNGMIGEFALGEKTWQVKHDENPRNDRIEHVVQRYLTEFDIRKKYQKKVKNPCIRKWAKFGLSWIEQEYDPYVNLPIGDIIFDVLHPKDVLVDPLSQKDYFVDARYIIRKKRVELSIAQKFLKENFDINEKNVTADTEYERYATYHKTSLSVDSMDRFVTFYYVEWKEICLDVYEQGVKERQLLAWEALYIPGKVGTVWMRKNPHVDPRRIDGWAFRRKPLVGAASEIRLYPQSIVEKLANIQDIINITKSLILDRERQKAKIWGFVLSKLKDNYGDLFKEWTKYGGLLPVDGAEDIKGAVSFLDIPNVSPETYQFAEMMEKSFKDQGPKREVLSGRLPDQRSDTPSGTAIQKLMEANTKVLTEAYDAMEWQDNEIAISTYNILATEMTEEDFIDFTDAKPDDPKYVPINAVMSLAEYEEHLQRMFPGVDPMMAAEMFEQKNDVEIHFATSDNAGRKMPGDVVKDKQSVVFVNMLFNPEGDKRFAMDIKVEIDFNAEKDKMEDRAMADRMRQRGEIALEDYYEFQGGRFAAEKDKLLENLAKERKEIAYGELVTERGPEFEAIVQQAAQNFDMINQQKEQLMKQAQKQGQKPGVKQPLKQPGQQQIAA